MDEEDKRRQHRFLNISTKDLFGAILFVSIPLCFFATNFVSEYKIYYYAILALFVAVYTLVGQFFFETDKMTSQGKKFISLTVINTLVISFVQFTGGLESSYYFILYFLIFAVSIFTTAEILTIECVLIFLSILIAEYHEYTSFVLIFKGINAREMMNLFSLLISLPLTVIISSFVKNLREKQELLMLSRELLAIRDIEDEALLEEINQGIIVVDNKLRIAKISRWIENNFNIAARLLLGKNILTLELYDPVSNKKFLKTDQFYANLVSRNPQTLNWKVMYKNQYGKFIQFAVKQTPLIVRGQKIGFLITVKKPVVKIGELVRSFNQLLNFRLSSKIAMVKNLLSISSQYKQVEHSQLIDKNINNVINILNDAALRNEIVDGNYSMILADVQLKRAVNMIIRELSYYGKVSVWNVSPLYQNREITLQTDATLIMRLIRYTLIGGFHLSRDRAVNLTFDEDENAKKPRIMMVTELPVKIEGEKDVSEPFFAGDLVILNVCKGSGLELSNADLIASYLGFDFNAKISNNKLVVKIIF